MKYYGKIVDPKDLVTKQYTDNTLSASLGYTDDQVAETLQAAKDYTDQHGGKIDTITVNNGSALPIVNKNVNIPAGSIASGDTNFTAGGDVYTALQNKQDNLPSPTNNYYLHANATTGALEWVELQVDVSNKADKTQLDDVLNTATAYTEAMTLLIDTVTGTKYRLVVTNGILGIQEVTE